MLQETHGLHVSLFKQTKVTLTARNGLQFAILQIFKGHHWCVTLLVRDKVIWTATLTQIESQKSR